MYSVLQKVLRAYFLEPDSFSNMLQQLTPNEVREALAELVDNYANDVNSSALRERITLVLAGYEPRKKKLGLNGFNRQTKIECDVKPVNIRSDSGERLNGGGNFSDLTPERVDEYEKREKTFHILASGFVDGHLVYVLELPYRCISQRIREQVKKRFPNWTRQPGEYVRGSTFSFTHYKDCSNLHVVFVSPHLMGYRNYLTKDLYQFLGGV